MSIETTVEELIRCADQESPGSALPHACYSDSQFFERELERVLRPGWHAVARWDELPERGDYRALNLFGERILLVRDASLRLRAYSGLCLHRGFPLAEGSGNTSRFSCPYHLWSYDLDGQLRGAPFMDERPDFDRSSCRLPELPIEEWQGFVLVSTDVDTEPLSPALGELTQFLSAFDLSKAVHVGVTDWDSPWNWKVMVENFLESYHHIGPHAENLGKTNPARGTHAVDIDGPCVVLENPSVGDAPPFWVFNVFPTMLFSQTGDPAQTTFWYEMQIDRHNHFHLRIHILVSEELAANQELVESLKDLVSKIHMEDIPVCKGIQAGIHSRNWSPGPLSRQEETLHQFHQLLANAITSA